MLLRIGVIAMSFSIVLAIMVVAIVTLRDKPEEVVATVPAAASPELTTEQAYQDPRDKMLDLPSPEPEPQPEQPAGSAPEPEAIPGPQPASASAPEPEPASESEPEPETGGGDALPLAGSD